MVPELPLQQSVDSPSSYSVDNYAIKQVASFSLKAKVLAKKNYSADRAAELSPTDLALGWGRMSDETVLEKIKISQSNRFYFWRVKSFVIPRREIERNSANMHLIPANDLVTKAIERVRPGDIISLTGSLVNATSVTDGWRWQSSQTRNDTGAGACELIYVESLNIITP